MLMIPATTSTTILPSSVSRTMVPVTMATSRNVYEQLRTTESAPVLISNSSSPSSAPRLRDDSSIGSPQPVSTTATTTTASIPITHSSSTLRRAESESQLFEDEADADYKDFLFYSRVVNGIISKQNSFYKDGSLKQETKQCLENIVRARHDGSHEDKPQQQHDCVCHKDQGQQLRQVVSPGRKQLGQYYYYATSTATVDGDSIVYPPAHHGMLRFATRAFVSSDPGDHDDDDDEQSSEEGVFDLEL
jgi:hypothetical protein